MDYQSTIEEMRFSSDKLVGFPAVKSALWPEVLGAAKQFVDQEVDEDDRPGFHDRLDAFQTLRSAEEEGGKPAVKVFRQMNEDFLRCEMSAALNDILPGNVNRLWGRNDFSGLQECFSNIFHIMQSSDSRILKKMPVLFFAGFIQILHTVPASRNSKWWENASRSIKQLTVSMEIVSGGHKKEEQLCLYDYVVIFVSGMKVLKTYIGEPFALRDAEKVVKALEKKEQNLKMVKAETMKGFFESLKRVHQSFAADICSSLDMQKEFARVCGVLKGTNAEKEAALLNKYANVHKKCTSVTAFLPIARDMGIMLQKLA